MWLFLISYDPFANTVLKPLENQYPSLINLPTTAEYIVVLGNGHRSDDTRSRVSQHSQTALMRLSEGIRLYRQSSNIKLSLLDTVEDENTHAFMQQQLAIELGVNEKDIIIDGAPKDTSEESQAVKKIVGHKPFVLVTSASHMPRAMKIFEDAWLNPVAAPTDYLSSNNADIFSIAKGEAYRKQNRQPMNTWEFCGISSKPL